MPDDTVSEYLRNVLGDADTISGHSSDFYTTNRYSALYGSSDYYTVPSSISGTITIDPNGCYATRVVEENVIDLSRTTGSLTIKRTNGQKIKVNNVEDLVTRLLVFMSANNIPFTVE